MAPEAAEAVKVPQETTLQVEQVPMVEMALLPTILGYQLHR
jgi:hypothetical protein